jgi:hypothetical protein
MIDRRRLLLSGRSRKSVHGGQSLGSLGFGQRPPKF